MTRRNLPTLFAALILMLPGVATAQGWSVINRFAVSGAPGGWDYVAVCPTAPEVYVSHSTQVNILNKDTGDSVGVIPNTVGVHGIAFAPEFGHGYTSNGKLNTVTVFDLKTHAVTGQIPTGENPDAIFYDEGSKMVVTCNGRSQDLTVINPADGKVVKTIPVGGKPETAVSDLSGHIFVNIEDKSEIAVIDVQKWEVTERFKIGTGKEPSGLAIDVKTHRLFVGCDNELLVVVDATTGKLIKELPIGEGCDGVAFDPGNHHVYSSNGSGTLTVIDEMSADNFKVLENVPTQKSARTLAADPVTHKVYLPAAEFLPQPPEDKGKKRPTIAPGTFRLLVIGEKQK